MASAFDRALAEAIATTATPELDDRVLQEVAQFLGEQIAALPRHLWIPYRVGMLVFAAQVRVRHRRRFEALDRGRRQEAIASWAHGPVPLLRQLFRPARSIALLALYER